MEDNMPVHFKSFDRDQPLLFSSALGDLIPQDHQVRFFIEAIECLNIPLNRFHVNYRGNGEAQYPPVMMLTLVIYCFANRIFSCRDIERATYDVLPVRFITGDLHPDFRTIAYFRKNNAQVFSDVFMEIVHLARTSGLVTLGTVSLDSSQFKANASKNRNYHIEDIEREKAECQQILDLMLEEEAKALREDNTPSMKDLPDDLNTPQKRSQIIKKAKLRLANLLKAEGALEKRAEEEYNKKREDYETKMAQREARKEQGQRKLGLLPHKPKEKEFDVNWQGNSTDPDSRLMSRCTRHSSVSQNYNVQTMADNGSRLVVAAIVTNIANDGGQLKRMVKQVEDTVGHPKCVLADQGYLHSSQMQAVEESGTEVLIPVGRNPVIDKHAYRIADQNSSQSNDSADSVHRSSQGRFLIGKRNQKKSASQDSEINERFSDPYLKKKQEQMQEEEQRKSYKKRGSVIESIFGIIKHNYKFVQFHLRGLFNAQSEMMLVFSVYNLKRLYKLGFNFREAKR